MPKKPKTYLRGYRCLKCNKKIPDEMADVGRDAQLFCSPKCHDAYWKKERKEIQAQKGTNELYKRPPVQEY